MEYGILERKQFRECWGKYYRSKEVEPYLRSLENQFQGSERRAKRLSEENEQLKEQLGEKDKEIEALKQQAAQVPAQSGVSAEALAQAQQEAQAAQAKLQEMETLFEAADNELKAEKQRADEAEAKLEKANPGESDLALKLEEAAAIQRSDKAALEVKEATIKALTVELERLRQGQAARESGASAAADLKARLDDAIANNQLLHNEIEELRQKLSGTEVGIKEKTVKEAQERAQQIVQDALKQSSEMLDNAQSMCARAFSATKTAYFNTLKFRQQITQQYAAIKSELDDSLGVLDSSGMFAISGNDPATKSLDEGGQAEVEEKKE